MGELVHLEFKSPHVVEEGTSLHACANCRNKTFTLTAHAHADFPMLSCAACHMDIGRMGWAHDDDPARSA